MNPTCLQTCLLLVRNMVPLQSLAPFSGANLLMNAVSKKNKHGETLVHVSLSVYPTKFLYVGLGNVQVNSPKLFQAFSVKFTLIFFLACVHSIIPHQQCFQHMQKLCILMQNCDF